jgi:hypothetical protein
MPSGENAELMPSALHEKAMTAATGHNAQFFKSGV